MENTPFSAADLYKRKRTAVLDIEMAYIDTGAGNPIVFLHGNPTCSYLWRNVIPHVAESGRCLAPDLAGMGESGKSPRGSYRFIDHVGYLDTWFDKVGVTDNVTLVVHDWGSALGFHWAYRHPDRVKGIVYMEAIVRPLTWNDWPALFVPIFQAIRSPAGEEMILQQNLFMERILPTTTLRPLTEQELEVYRRPYLEPGESRLPLLVWPRELPFDGKPEDVYKVVAQYANWLATADIPKLFINANPGALLVGSHREFCRSWPNQQEITVNGRHLIQEDAPAEIGRAIASFITERL
jgi:haloalkane dehalogenase